MIIEDFSKTLKIHQNKKKTLNEETFKTLYSFLMIIDVLNVY